MLRSKSLSSMVNYLASVGGLLIVVLLTLGISANAQSTTDYFGNNLPDTGLMTLNKLNRGNRQFAQQAQQGAQQFPRQSQFTSGGAAGSGANNTETTGTQTLQGPTDYVYTSKGAGNGASNPNNPYNLTQGPANKKFPKPTITPPNMPKSQG